MIARLKSYWMPGTATFWVGLASIVIGCAMAAGVGDAERLGVIAQVITALQGGGDSSPAGLIVLGMGLIGIRRAQGVGQ